MGGVALEVVEFEGEDHAVAAPVFHAEAIVAGGNAGARGTVTEGAEDLWHDARAGLALRLLLDVSELRTRRLVETKFRRVQHGRQQQQNRC